MFLLNGLVQARRSRAVGRGMVNWVCDVPNFPYGFPRRRSCARSRARLKRHGC